MSAVLRGLGQLVNYCNLRFGQEKTVEMVDRLKELGFNFATRAGISIGIDDMVIPANKDELVMAARKEQIDVEKLYLDGIRDIVVDLGEVRWFGASMMGVLSGVLGRMKERGGDVQNRQPPLRLNISMFPSPWGSSAQSSLSLSTSGQSLNKGAMRMLGTLLAVVAALTLLAWFPQQRSCFMAVVS